MAKNTNAFVKHAYDKLSEAGEFTCKVNTADLSPMVKEIISHISKDTMKTYYGCGLIIPDCLEGKKVLDMGCGSGSLVFILSKLVGPTGSVTGVDFSSNLIGLAKQCEEYHRAKWGYRTKNTHFAEANCENLDFPDQSFDVVVSNGLFCLVGDRAKAFSESFRVLKDGGEHYFDDMCAESMPVLGTEENLKEWDKDGEEWLGTLKEQCLTGALLAADFMHFSKKAGFLTPYLTCVGNVGQSQAYRERLAGRRYVTAGYRLFRIGSTTRRSASSVTYKGNIAGKESVFKWDVDLSFKKGQPVSVDAELASILAYGCYRNCFEMTDTAESPITKRGQDPFAYKDKIEAEGKTLPLIYTVE